jgi:ProP effector
MPDLDDKQVRFALKLHTGSTRYLKSLANGDKRFDLDGNPVGEIAVEQRQQALECLKDRFRKKAEQHRVEQVKKQKLEEEQQRQQKLLKLAEKFGR